MVNEPGPETPSVVELGGLRIEVSSLERGPAVSITARLDGEHAVTESELRDATLAAPGDISFDHRDGSIEGHRLLAAPGPGDRDDAIWGLAKRLAQVGLRSTRAAATDQAEERMRQAALPPLEIATEIAELDDRTRIVAAPTPTWVEPDPEGEPGRELTPGRRYEVVQERGGWAQVVDEHGEPVWLDARALIPGKET